MNAPVNPTLGDEDLTRLLGEAAAAYDVPEQGRAYVLEERADAATGRPWLRRRGVQLVAVAAALVTAAVLVQSAGGPSSSSKQDNTVAGGVQREPAFDSGGAGTDTGGTTGGGATGLGEAQAPAPLPAPQDGSGLTYGMSPQLGTGQTTSGAAPIDGADARVVKTGSIALAVDDGKVPATVTRVTAVVRAARGYVSDSTSEELGDSPSASVTFRIPVDSFESVLGQIRALKAEVVSQQSSGKDVTASYADTQAQIASLKAARARFLTILSGARTIGEVLTVQQRVDDVQSRIDRLEGQRRVLADQSDLATLTVTVGEKADAVLKSNEPSGLSKAWDDAVDGFTSGVEALIARSGRALLVLIVAAVAFFVLRLGWRLARRRLV